MKLTLSAKPEVIRQAKKLAAKNGTSVSAMFETYITQVSRPEGSQQISPATPKGGGSRPRSKYGLSPFPLIGPIARKASGLVSMPKNKTYRELLEEALLEKYGR